MFSTYFTALAAVAAFGISPQAQDQHAAHKAETKLMKGASVAIEGCVTAGQKRDSFVLASVKEIPGALFLALPCASDGVQRRPSDDWPRRACCASSPFEQGPSGCRRRRRGAYAAV